MNAARALEYRQLWLAVSSVSPPTQAPSPGRRKWFRRVGRVCWQEDSHPGHWPVLTHSLLHFSCPDCVWLLDPTGAVKVLRGRSRAHRGKWLVASAQLTCVCQLLQVWDMAATETQLMLSVGLIGKFRLSCVFYLSAGLESNLPPETPCRRITWWQCDPSLVYRSCMFSLCGWRSWSNTQHRPHGMEICLVLWVGRWCWLLSCLCREGCEWRHAVGVVLSLCGLRPEESPAQQVLPDSGWPGLPHLCVWSVLSDLVLHHHSGGSGTHSFKQGPALSMNHFICLSICLSVGLG